MDKSKNILSIDKNVSWLPQPNECHMVLSSQLPSIELISTSLALAFDGNQILMTQLTDRGWDIPGGHIEPGETPEEAVCREVYEETRATLKVLHLFAYQKLLLYGPKPRSYNYPYPENYQVFFYAQVASLDPFIPTAETQGRAFFTPNEAQKLSWVQRHKELYDKALAFASQDK
jgi:8-oxo-dGTP diphosphatase